MKTSDLEEYLEIDNSRPRQTYYRDEWVGKVCRFWDNNYESTKNRCWFYVLWKIAKNDPFPFAVQKPTGDITSFRYCEPLTETDIAEKEFQVKDWENGIPTVPKGE